jgi:hypothetical protein
VVIRAPQRPSDAAVEVAFLADPPSQRRWTVLIRLVLLVPNFVVLWVLSIVAEVVVVLGWFGALAMGRLPRFAQTFLVGWLRWNVRVQAYCFFLTDRYPPFGMEPDATYPVALEVRASSLNRAAVLFRIVLVLPAALLATLVNYGLALLGVISWIVVLIVGRMPPTLHLAVRSAIRFSARVVGYFSLLTPTYPDGLFGDPAGTLEMADPGAPGAAGTWPGAPPVTGWPSDVPNPTGARGVLTWRIFPTTRAKWLVSGLIALGAIVAVAGVATDVAIANNIGSAHQLNDAYSTLSGNAQAFETAVGSCESTTNQFHCAEQAVGHFADQLDSFAATVSDIDFPPGAHPAATALIASSRSAAAIMSNLAASPDPATYQQRAQGADIQQRLDTVDSDYRSLYVAAVSD